MEKQISVSNEFKEMLGVKSVLYDRGNITIKVTRKYLSRWVRSVYWYTSSVFEPDIIEMHYRVHDFLDAFFGLKIDFHVPEKKEELHEAPQGHNHA